MPEKTPRLDYPRPQFFRQPWFSLNGRWEFEIDPDGSGKDKGWHSGHEFRRRICVPFAPESSLSGIGERGFLPSVWYRRHFTVPPQMRGKRLLLHFGAVDYEAQVWLNSEYLGSHSGGYTPFQFDITAFVKPSVENELVVWAKDDLHSGLQPSGKQSKEPESHGCVYTRSTGIWQTVWLEAVPEAHLAAVRIWPDANKGEVRVEVDAPAGAPLFEAEVLSKGDRVAHYTAYLPAGSHFGTLQLPHARPWSPADPFLYDLVLRIRDGQRVDEVHSYFGLRTVSIDGDRILLNGRPVFLRFVLDQGYYPDGIYTAPANSALKRDITLSQKMGFNGARLHQKVFEPGFLHWADRLGYMVWAEFPDWGCEISPGPAAFAAQANFLREWKEAVLRDLSHPCVVAWVPFNETTIPGRHDAEFLREVYQVTHSMDPTRPVVDTSGYTHVETDIWDVHDYDQNPETFAARYRAFTEGRGQPVVVSEYGGIWWLPEDARVEGSWGYGDRPKSRAGFIARFKGLTRALLNNRHIAGFCYTQLCDVEQETNGLLTYGRRLKFPSRAIRGIVAAPAAIET